MGQRRRGTHQSGMAPGPAGTLPWGPGFSQPLQSTSAALRHPVARHHRAQGLPGKRAKASGPPLSALSSATNPGAPQEQRDMWCHGPPPQSLLKTVSKPTIISAQRGEPLAPLSQMLKSLTTQGFETPLGILLSRNCSVQILAGQADRQMSLCLSSGPVGLAGLYPALHGAYPQIPPCHKPWMRLGRGLRSR